MIFFPLEQVFLLSSIEPAFIQMIMTLAHYRVSNFDLIYRYFVNELTANVIEMKILWFKVPCVDWRAQSHFGFNEIRCESFWMKKTKRIERTNERKKINKTLELTSSICLAKWQNSLTVWKLFEFANESVIDVMSWNEICRICWSARGNKKPTSIHIPISGAEKKNKSRHFEIGEIQFP